MRFMLTAIAIGVYLLHQDLWFWKTARPLVFGFMPVGLFYHGIYCLVCSGMMLLLVRFAWPADLDEASSTLPREDDGR